MRMIRHVVHLHGGPADGHIRDDGYDPQGATWIIVRTVDGLFDATPFTGFVLDADLARYRRGSLEERIAPTHRVYVPHYHFEAMGKPPQRTWQRRRKQ